MAIKYTTKNALHYVTFTVVGWVDIFTRKVYKDILVDSLKYCQENKGMILFSYVIMSNHIHLILRTDSEKGLSFLIRDYKSYTAKKIIQEIKDSEIESRREWMLRLLKYYAKYNSNNQEYQLWKQDNHPIELISPKWINQKLDYIHHNPLKAGNVDRIEDYRYSSGSNYVNRSGLLEIELLELGPSEGYSYLG